ncbi:MAG: TonB C-terminal domain-containing protein [Thermodesulfobacteriota bacterium]
MVGQLKFSPQDFFLTRWEDEKWRNPFLFSAAIHLAILCIALLPSDLFFFSRNIPEIYSVDLIDLDEIPLPPDDVYEPAPRENAAPTENSRSLQPLLSTRTIPKAPTEIKLIRPRALKKDVRLPPMDPTMVLAALDRIQQQEKAVTEKEKALKAIRQSIMARESASEPVMDIIAPAKTGTPTGSGSQRGMAANTALKKYKALVAQHIGRFWSLPEGQIWPKDLRAIVIIEVRLDGIVTESSFEKLSANGQFDKFVMQTIEQSSPLPPFPEEIPHRPLRLKFYPEGMM